MNVFSKLTGVMNALFRIGGPTGPNLKANGGAIELRNSADNAFATGRALPIASGGGANDVATLLNLQARIPSIGFDFDGASPPSAGANTSKFGFVHTTGGSYTQGQVVYDSGTSLVIMPSEVVRAIATSTAISGGISLNANGFYVLHNGAWALRGDGNASGTGNEKTILVEFAFGDTAGVSSTTEVPDGAVVLSCSVQVDTVFDNTPTLVVIVDGATDQTLMASSDSSLLATGVYVVDDPVTIDAAHAGVVKVTVGGTPTAGTGKVFVSYVIPSA